MANSLNGLDLFASVVEAGSFAQAAERLHLTRSAVGRIARLEQRRGVQLFHRTTRSQSLTEEGRCSIVTACGRWRCASARRRWPATS